MPIPNDEEMGEGGGAESGGEDTFFLPPEYPNAETLKPGDEIKLRVVGKDPRGGVEVQCVHDESQGSWKDQVMADMKQGAPDEGDEGAM